MGKGKKAGKRMNKKELAELLVKFFEDAPGKTFSFKEIFRKLNLTTHPLKMLAIDIMEEMAWDDYLTRVTDSSYKLDQKGHSLEGTFIRKRTGKNSFLADGTDQPIFVAERNSLFALDGDRVRVTMMARRNKHMKEAVVTEIIQRKKQQFVGKVQIVHDVAYVSPEGENLYRDIIIPQRLLHKAEADDKVIVRVTEWPKEERGHMIGEVITNLGRTGDNNTEMHAILAQYGLPYDYPQECIDAAERISEEITAEDYAEREDCRDVFTCTIDPRDAKDFDDALSLRAMDDGTYEVGVHIADVSHYVKEGSVIDKEAQKRATSVYLVDRTIPMLPERLCNLICSLRPNEEKLAYSVIFNMDEEANIRSWRLRHTVIKSNRRFTYEEAQVIIDENEKIKQSGKQLSALEGYTADEINAVLKLWGLAAQLRERRFKAGAVRFDREEMRFEIDEKGKPVRCYFKKSREANKLVEEFMLLANRTVAESVGHVKKGKVAKTLPYRVHDVPDPTKLETLREFITKFGYKLKTAGTKGAVTKSLNQLLTDCQGQAEQKLIETVAIRAMMKAKYTVHNIGHYGLAFDYYTHFTSPIRRYPDTMVHRLLTHYADGGRSANKDKYEELCEHSSNMEVTAAMAERDSIKYKMVEFMAGFIGQEFDAHISGVASYGIYCEIDENHCEGLVPMADLSDDYYEFDEKNYCLKGRRRHAKYQLGDAIRIKVAKADMNKRQLDFVLAD